MLLSDLSQLFWQDCLKEIHFLKRFSPDCIFGLLLEARKAERWLKSGPAVIVSYDRLSFSVLSSPFPTRK